MISIVTPSFGQLEWLRLCVASIADQQGSEIEHVVQDGGSDGISETTLHRSSANPNYQFRFFREKDDGMYDAVNRGLRRTKGEICAYLNCDEQYLPGALYAVAREFERKPTLDLLLAGSVVVDGDGKYICSRPALQPSLSHLRAGRMYNLTSSIFFRASLFRNRGLFFDPQLRIVGDMDWLRRVVEGGAQVGTLNIFTSAFSDLGTNLALTDAGTHETRQVEGPTNPFQSLKRKAAIGSHRVRRLLAGHYHMAPFSYAIYLRGNNKTRRTFRVEKPTGVWHNRL